MGAKDPLSAPADTPASTPVTPREAASLIILRGDAEQMQVLMGRRAETARFMPNYLVFPGGAVDPEDDDAVTAGWAPTRFHAAALRETWEETSAMIGITNEGKDDNDALAKAPHGAALHRAGLRPEAGRLVYAARAITPATSPIRFDTRFFVTGTAQLHGTPQAAGELPEVDWMPIAAALSHPNVSGVTRFALSEALRRWAMAGSDNDVVDPIRIYTYLNDSRVILPEEPGTGLL